MPHKTELPEYRIAKLHLEPGDTLVAKIDREMTPETSERIHDYIRRCVSSQVKVLVIGPGVELLQIKPPVPDA